MRGYRRINFVRGFSLKTPLILFNAFLTKFSAILRVSTFYCHHFKRTHMFCILLTVEVKELRDLFIETVEERPLRTFLAKDRSTGKGVVFVKTEVCFIFLFTENYLCLAW